MQLSLHSPDSIKPLMVDFARVDEGIVDIHVHLHVHVHLSTTSQRLDLGFVHAHGTVPVYGQPCEPTCTWLHVHVPVVYMYMYTTGTYIHVHVCTYVYVQIRTCTGT